MKTNFPGQTAVYVSSPYGKEHSCKKSEKSLGRFSRKVVYQPTNYPTTVTWPKGHMLNVSTLHHVNIYSMSSCLTCPNSTFIPFHLVNMSNLYIRHSKTIGQNCHFWPLLAITMLIMIIKDRFPRQETPFL